MEAAEQSLLLSQYTNAAQQAYAITQGCASHDNPQDNETRERALFIVVQAMCLDGKHREALECVTATYGTSKRMPARLLGLWYLMNDNCSEALDLSLSNCSLTDDPAAVLALLCQQAYGRKGHAKLTAFIHDHATSMCISHDVQQSLLDSLSTAKDAPPEADASPATTPAASTSTTECAADDATQPDSQTCCFAVQDHVQDHPASQQSVLVTRAQDTWHGAQQLLSTKEGKATAFKVGAGALAALVVAAAAYQERKAIARAVRRAGATLQQEFRSTLGMAVSVVPNPLSHASQQLQSRL